MGNLVLRRENSVPVHIYSPRCFPGHRRADACDHPQDPLCPSGASSFLLTLLSFLLFPSPPSCLCARLHTKSGPRQESSIVTTVEERQSFKTPLWYVGVDRVWNSFFLKVTERLRTSSLPWLHQPHPCAALHLHSAPRTAPFATSTSSFSSASP